MVAYAATDETNQTLAPPNPSGTGTWTGVNPRPTQVDPSIPFIPRAVLPNHPACPSGHSCITAAYATVLAAESPAERERLEAMVAEASVSRIVATFHYRVDLDAGEQLGRDVAHWVLAHAVPKRGPIPLD